LRRFCPGTCVVVREEASAPPFTQTLAFLARETLCNWRRRASRQLAQALIKKNGVEASAIKDRRPRGVQYGEEPVIIAFIGKLSAVKRRNSHRVPA
jgi:hypothetical protein